MIFCKNCKWCKKNYSTPITHPFDCKHNSFLKTTPYSLVWRTGLEAISEGIEYNKDNDCEYYERKWWKFWVKA